MSLSKLSDKAGRLQAARYYRLAFRDIASSTNERTGVFCFCPPSQQLSAIRHHVSAVPLNEPIPPYSA